MSTDEIRVTDPNTGGQKGQKPCRMELIPPDVLWRLGLVYGKGAQKYADDNWLKGYSWRLSIGALKRHLAQFEMGEYLDKDDGEPHLAHAMFHCATLMEFHRLGRGTDDRQVTSVKRVIDPKRIYIAGPMRGISRYNFPAFDEAAQTLTRKGWVPVNPADLDRENGFDPITLPADYDWHSLPPGFDFDLCRKRDIMALESCAAILMLRGWDKSTGARAEYAYAKWCGKIIMEQQP